MLKPAVFLITFLLAVVTARAQHTWHFENAEFISTAKLPLSFESKVWKPELVDGITGKGLRTDGYSVWLKTALPVAMNNKPVSIAGYFALETYPTDTAGFFSLADKNGSSWISTCIDRFGKPMLGINAGGTLTYYPVDAVLPKFKWLHIGLNIKNNAVELLINGDLQRTAEINAEMPNLDSLYIGRDKRDKFVNIFPVTLINGIIDEVTIRPALLTPVGLSKQGLKQQLSKLPNLNVPDTRFAGDFNRPKYHLLPAANWTNEPHGLVYYDKQYHIFNQKNGANLFLGQINWGHYTSTDLISWTEQVPAITPEPGYDENGIWSGHTVIDKDGKPVIMYTGGGGKEFTMGLAYPADSNLLVWNKYKGNPVVRSSPDGFERKDLHDPYIFREGDTWYMIIGFGLVEKEQQKGSLLLYKSTDLKKWQFLHPLFSGDPEKDDSGVFWEMPVFWKMNGKYILLVNKVPHKRRPAVALYWTGNFVNEKFVPDHIIPKKLEIINRLLSPSVALDADGNTTAIAIIPDETSAKATELAGWTHLYSIPRIWTLHNGSIYQQPHPSLQKLRAALETRKDKTVAPGVNYLLSQGRHQLEISVDLLPENSSRFGFTVGKNADGTEFTKIYFDVEKGELIVDQSKSTLRKYYPLQVRTGVYKATPGKKLNLRLFIDGSVIEGFINNKEAFTTRLFPQKESSNRVELFTDDGLLKASGIKVWPLKSSNNKTNFSLAK